MNPLSEASWPPLDPDRRRALVALFRGVVGVAALSGLQACGGGGDAPSPSPVPAPAPEPPPSPAPPPPGPIAAQMTVPIPVGYDADRLAAFNRLNEIRLSAGLGMLAQDVLLDRAAQAHAAWIVANDSFTHEETAGTPGFTGAHWSNRAEAAGYVPLGGDEVMVAMVHGAQGVDVLMNGVYHRAAMLAFEPVDVGIGWSAGTASTVSWPLVVDMTCPGGDRIRSAGQAEQSSIDGVAIWPLEGAASVPLRLGLESPNPVPSQDVLTLGTPASITIGRGRTIAVESFSMSDDSTRIEIPARMLVNANDPNGSLPGSFAAVVPLSPLAANTSYRVVFSGSATDILSGAREVISRSWAFRTAAS